MSKTSAWSVTELHCALCRPGADLSPRAPRVVDGSAAPTGIVIQDHRDMFVNFTLTVSRLLSSSSPLSFSPTIAFEIVVVIIIVVVVVAVVIIIKIIIVVVIVVIIIITTIITITTTTTKLFFFFFLSSSSSSLSSLLSTVSVLWWL